MGLLDEAIREHLDLKRRRGADPTEIERAEREALGPVRREPVATVPMDEPTFASAPVFSDARDESESFDHEEPIEAPRPHKRRGFFGRSRHEPDDEAHVESMPDRPRRDPGFDEAVDQALRTSPGELPERFADLDEPDLPATSIYERPGESAPGEPLDLDDLAVDRERDDLEAEEPSASIPPPVAASRPPVSPANDTLGETTEFDVEREYAESSADHQVDPSPDGGDVLEETPEFLQDTPDHDRLWFEQRPPRDFDFGG